MPILRKNDRKLYFAHIPKTAGSSLYWWLLQNNWQIANFGGACSRDRPVRADTIFRKEFGIAYFQHEGDHSTLTTSPQHAPADIWQTWGPFDQSFAIVREPIARFRSAICYSYDRFINRHKFDNNIATLTKFREEALNRLVTVIEKQPNMADNHFLPQQCFITDQTKLYFFDQDWVSQIGNDLGLSGEIAHMNKSNLKIELTEPELRFAEEHFQNDIRWYADLRAE
ncbi:MAG: hypothetical protein COB37_04660 [Kordiimonadales bacterium]|nr:MAG: hypothetical protein COB37_04660 [Kordiimonadales bacterium]